MGTLGLIPKIHKIMRLNVTTLFTLTTLDFNLLKFYIHFIAHFKNIRLCNGLPDFSLPYANVNNLLISIFFRFKISYKKLNMLQAMLTSVLLPKISPYL